MEREEGAGREGGEEGVTGFITFELCLKKKIHNIVTNKNSFQMSCKTRKK